MDEFLQRLKQRRLVQWTLAYLAASFALIQVLDIVANRFGWPEPVIRCVIVVLAIGFFVALVVAWYHGDKGAQRVSGVELVILALLLVIGGVALLRFGPKNETEQPALSSKPESTAAPIPAKSIAVLPFENLSDDKSNAYFADGMQEEILTRLAGIGDLKVISRTSTKHYASKPENLKTVANELGVANILEGSVQKAADTVRINVQLIDAHNDTHLWAQTYDRELKNVFSVESEVAQQIAEVLKAQLSPREEKALATVPTKNAAAYDQFLKAEDLSHKARDSRIEAEYLVADNAYRQVLALDPDFALAYARLASNELDRHWYVGRFSATQLAEVKALIDRALSLAPDLPEARIELASYHYHGFYQYDEAVAQLQRVLRLTPNNGEALSMLGYIHRRKGELEEALTALQNAAVFSPQDAILPDEIGITELLLRRYDEADRQFTRAMNIDAGFIEPRAFLLVTRLFGTGDVGAARAALDGQPGWHASVKSTAAGDVLNLVNPLVYPDIFERRFDAALQAWESAPVQSEKDRLTQRAARAAIRVIAGQREQSQGECAQLKPLVDAELAAQPESLPLLSQVAWVDLCLGRNDEAIDTMRRATQLLPLSKDAFYGAYQLCGLAQVDVQAGAFDEALQLIQRLLDIPAGATMTVERLKRDPVFDPLRDDPRFAQLVGRNQPVAKH